MCPLRGERARGLAPSAGAGEARFWADPATVGWFNSSRQLHNLVTSLLVLATVDQCVRLCFCPLRRPSPPSYKTPPCEAPMLFTLRPYRRFPVCCPVTYQCGLFEGYGTVWNLSLMGWRFSGNLPLRIGEVCSLTVNLPTQETVYVAAGIVRWMGGEEYGVEILMMDDESREDLE
jgi:PilZ domain-containing protein